MQQEENNLKRNHQPIEYETESPSSILDNENIWCSEEVDAIVFQQSEKRKLSDTVNETVDQQITQIKFHDLSNRTIDFCYESEDDEYESDSDSEFPDGIVGSLGYSNPLSTYLSDFCYEPNLLYETRVSLTRIPIDGWVNIYSFLDFENYFINRIYKLNSTLKNNLYESTRFWKKVTQHVLKWKDYDIMSINWKEYLFKKYIAYETHKRLNPQYIHIKDSLFKSVGIQTTFDSNCFIFNSIGTCFYNEDDNSLRSASMNWHMNIFLETAPKIICLKVETKLIPPRIEEFTISAMFNGEEFEIFAKDTLALKGIMSLFKSLQLNGEYCCFESVDPRFKDLKFGDLKDFYDFFWFCNSILIHVPFPIEEIMGKSDYSKDLRFEEDTHDCIEKYFKYKKMIEELK